MQQFPGIKKTKQFKSIYMTATSLATVYIPDIEGEMYDLDVEFTGEASVQDDSFDHEFGTQSYPKYLIVEEFTWDKTKQTDWVNAAISAYLDNHDNWKKVEEELVKSIMEGDDGND